MLHKYWWVEKKNTEFRLCGNKNWKNLFTSSQENNIKHYILCVIHRIFNPPSLMTNQNNSKWGLFIARVRLKQLFRDNPKTQTVEGRGKKIGWETLEHTSKWSQMSMLTNGLPLKCAQHNHSVVARVKKWGRLFVTIRLMPDIARYGLSNHLSPSASSVYQ